MKNPYDKWPLSNSPWMKFFNSHGKYKPGLNKYFHMHQCQLNFAMSCATSALGISWQHLNYPNLLACGVYKFHVYFHIWLILHNLGIFYLMKMVSARLKILILKEHLSIFVMTMALMRMKHTCMGIGSIWHTKIFLAMKSRKQKGPHQTILHDGSSHSQKALQKRALKR